jgi:hypothetical protein
MKIHHLGHELAFWLSDLCLGYPPPKVLLALLLLTLHALAIVTIAPIEPIRFETHTEI